MDELKKKFQEEIDKRNKLTNTIKTQMDELSKNFSEQLAVRKRFYFFSKSKKIYKSKSTIFRKNGKATTTM